MTEAEELAWLRNWRERVLSAMRLWWKPKDYKDACQKWSQVERILSEKPEGLTKERKVA